ncbi:uncharacterized protein TNCV_1030501 [Trichonephila clavipes]|nr:uncharacterized protein TNCV_1030501 [Trichonephila clavipes]
MRQETFKLGWKKSLLPYNNSVRESVFLLENFPLNAAHEWQYYRLNYQTDVQICSQCVWDSPESGTAVIGNCFPDHDDSRYRSSVSRRQTVWSLAFPWPPSDQHKVITGTKAEPASIRRQQQIFTPSCNDLWLDTTGVANSNNLESMECTIQSVWLGVVLEMTNF